jgi:hypothetical protein
MFLVKELIRGSEDNKKAPNFADIADACAARYNHGWGVEKDAAEGVRCFCEADPALMFQP